MEVYRVNQINEDLSLQRYMKDLIISEVQKVGFELWGVARVSEGETVQFLQEWVANNFHAGMEWFSKSIGTRENIMRWFYKAKSIIVVGEGYYHECNHNFVALYAHGVDYHIRLRNKLKQVSNFIKNIVKDYECKISVDTSPVHEKYWAQKAGLGWQGRNTLIINPTYGSWFNVGVLAVNFVLPEDPQVENRCEMCTKCIDSCPTNALLYPGILDSNKCISYHTIENKGVIPPEISERNKRYIFGCDLCQIVCPWNKRCSPVTKTEICDESIFKEIESIISSGRIQNITAFKSSPLKRLGVNLLKRNISFLNR